MEPRTLVVMEGDQTGQELLEEALRVLDPAVTGFPITIARHDLSLENRRRTRNGCVFEAAEATVRHGHDIAGRVRSSLRESPLRIADALVHIEPFQQGTSDAAI